MLSSLRLTCFISRNEAALQAIVLKLVMSVHCIGQELSLSRATCARIVFGLVIVYNQYWRTSLTDFSGVSVSWAAIQFSFSQSFLCSSSTDGGESFPLLLLAEPEATCGVINDGDKMEFPLSNYFGTGCATWSSRDHRGREASISFERTQMHADVFI